MSLDNRRTSRRARALAVFGVAIGAAGPAAAHPADPEEIVHVPDAALRACIEEKLEKGEGESIRHQEIVDLRSLGCSERGVASLAGIEHAENLETLNLWKNRISNLEPLARLTSLRTLFASYNRISDLAPLAGLKLIDFGFGGNGVVDLTPLADMTSLEELSFWGNQVVDLAPLAGMVALTKLTMWGNPVSDLAPLADLSALTSLLSSDAEIADLAPLANLTELVRLSLHRNRISDLTALVSNTGIGEGDEVGLTENPLSYKSVTEDIPELLDRGVKLSFSDVKPLSEGAEIVEFADEAIERVVRQRLRKGEGWPIAASELELFLGLNLAGLGVEDLAGLEFATGLVQLDLSYNRVADLGPLAGLGSLQALWLSGNPVSDVSPIADLPSLGWLALDDTGVGDGDLAALTGLPNLFRLALDGNSLRSAPAFGSFASRGLRHLSLSNNELSNVDALANLPELRRLSLDGNSISSLAPLAGLTLLGHLNVNGNQVADLDALEGLGELRELLARNNRIGDLSPLRGGELAFVDLEGNPLGGEAVSRADAWRESGATVLLGHVVPYFPAAGGDREGIVRIVNRGDDAGEVFVEAVDDAGARFGPVRFPLGPRRAVHVGSGDWENGSAAKGIAGVGAPTAGDWRLAVSSPLDVEALAYVRHGDGFLTAMHDVAPGDELPFFNPGANTRQRSVLRVVNREAGPAKWLAGGRDDNGNWRAMRDLDAAPVLPGRAFVATARELEQEHGLGDGAGKWRLKVPRWPWLATSLLESPTGHLTNLSTAPVHAERLADGRTRHHVPLFLAGDASRWSFARVVNRSAHGGEVEIEGVDDAGRFRGPLRLDVPARRTVHFNSGHLRGGSAARGLSGGLGAGSGDWRLFLTTSLDVQVLAYVRTADGYLAALHDLAPEAEDGSRRVVFFNPGGDANVSSLRLINNGGAAARVAIDGTDDAGRPSGTATLAVPAWRASTFTAAQLEAGGEGMSGRLGDGTGRWRLRVRSDQPLAVMSLLESPAGHLANLSTATARAGRR